MALGGIPASLCLVPRPQYLNAVNRFYHLSHVVQGAKFASCLGYVTEKSVYSEDLGESCDNDDNDDNKHLYRANSM